MGPLNQAWDRIRCEQVTPQQQACQRDAEQRAYLAMHERRADADAMGWDDDAWEQWARLAIMEYGALCDAGAHGDVAIREISVSPSSGLSGDELTDGQRAWDALCRERGIESAETVLLYRFVATLTELLAFGRANNAHLRQTVAMGTALFSGTSLGDGQAPWRAARGDD